MKFPGTWTKIFASISSGGRPQEEREAEKGSRGESPETNLLVHGSSEPDDEAPTGVTAGFGAAMFDPTGGAFQSFGGNLTDELLEILTAGGTKRQVVGQSEIFPCLAAREVWKKKLKGRLLMSYTDNEAARYALIKGTSPTYESAWLVQHFWGKEVELETFSWTQRVPSAANCADNLSRGIPEAELDGRKSRISEAILAVSFCARWHVAVPVKTRIRTFYSQASRAAL